MIQFQSKKAENCFFATIQRADYYRYLLAVTIFFHGNTKTIAVNFNNYLEKPRISHINATIFMAK